MKGALKHMKHLKKHRPVRAKALLLIASLAVLLTATVGSTAAWLVSKPAAVENDFVPGKVACQVLENFGTESGTSVKRSVRVKNNGNTDAYIRVLLVFTWKDDAGNIFSNKPQEGSDYQINMDLTDWIKQESDAGTYYYYKKPVARDAETDVLIELLRQADGVTGPENGKYKLSVDILADAVQADPPEAVAESWGVAVENGEIKVQGGASHE